MKEVKFKSIILSLFVVFACSKQNNEQAFLNSETDSEFNNGIVLTILGTAQDAGAPQIGCNKECCTAKFLDESTHESVVSLGVTDFKNSKSYLFEATPDITTQWEVLRQKLIPSPKVPDGIFLTHAHIGHYTGLMYLGKEVMNASKVPVYSMPKMQEFLSNNGPWSQLVSTSNIELKQLKNNTLVLLDDSLAVKPIIVPHRDEFSETVGYIITGPFKSALFIPDIDKWERWNIEINDLLKEVDYAFLDATFYDGEELNYRDMSEIPHPFVVESMAHFNNLTKESKNKVYFIHFNHTNPVLNPLSKQSKLIEESGFHIARTGDQFKL